MKVTRSLGGSGAVVQSLASRARQSQEAGDAEAARAAYDELVRVMQRRASRLAFFYLRDAAEADDAVQDAFIKAYMHLATYREAVPFEPWFTRILVNGCLDRLKSRRRRFRWISEADAGPGEARPESVAADPSPEDALLADERHRDVTAAIQRLPERQRTVVLLTHLDGRSPREVSQITGLNENTVRVHLFRAVRRLRGWLAPASADTAPRKAEA
jgi:RNA polymerase sigma-70 factor (ECF subfamily)